MRRSYTTDNSNPTNSPTSVGPIASGTTLSLQFPAGASNLTFKVIAVRTNYQSSAIVPVVFSATNLVPYGAPSIQINNQFAVGTIAAVGSAQLTISSGFPDGFIFYTLDGTMPTIGWPFYTGPVTLTDSAIVQAMGLSADFSQTAFAPAVTVQIIPVYNLQTSVVGRRHNQRRARPTAPMPAIRWWF